MQFTQNNTSGSGSRAASGDSGDAGSKKTHNYLSRTDTLNYHQAGVKIAKFRAGTIKGDT